jgi:hypothetical protein
MKIYYFLYIYLFSIHECTLKTIYDFFIFLFLIENLIILLLRSGDISILNYLYLSDFIHILIILLIKFNNLQSNLIILF